MAMSCSKSVLDFGSKKIKLKIKSVDTKGTVITTGNFTSQCPDGFMMDVWLDEEAYDHTTGDNVGVHYVDDYHVAWTGSAFQTNFYWTNGINTRFWMWAPVDVPTRTLDNADQYRKAVLAFSYEQPSSGTTSDADAQKDLLFSYIETSREFYENGSIKGGKTDAIDIVFHHALSEVGFAYHSTDGTFSGGLNINWIKVRGVKGNGTCIYDGSDDSFTWTPGGSTFVFGQTYKIDHDHPEDVSTIPDLVSNPDPLKSMHMNNPFFMIPQTLGSDAIIEAEFRRSDGTTLICQTPIPNEQWVAGKYYSYKIIAKTLQEDVEFSVSVTEWQNGGSAELTPRADS